MQDQDDMAQLAADSMPSRILYTPHPRPLAHSLGALTPAFSLTHASQTPVVPWTERLQAACLLHFSAPNVDVAVNVMPGRRR